MSPTRSFLRATAAAGAFACSGWANLAPAASSTPLRIIQAFDHPFPPRLLAAGVTSGQIRAALLVGPDGRLLDWLVLAYSHEDLADELGRCLAEWRYEPARNDGEPVATRTEVQFHFEASGAVLSLSTLDTVAALNRWLPSPPVSLLCPAGELDQPLAALQTTSPVNPGASQRQIPATGEAVIDFYVDATGRPRMPAIARATHDAFGAAALDAVVQWRFRPPTRQGKPVCVRVRQLFQFQPPPPTAPPPGPAG